METTETQDEGPRSFATLLANMSEGEADCEVSAQLHDLMKRMREESFARNDKVKGKLTLSVNFLAEPNGFVGVSYDVVTKAPRRRTRASVFWLTKGANLSPENPRQQKLPLRDVSAVRQEPRDVPAEAPAAAREV